MKYNFDGAFGGRFTAKNFANTVKFIHAYNEAKERAGKGASQEQILAVLNGYEPALARQMIAAINAQFGRIPTKDQEAEFMQDYHEYMKNKYEEQRQRVESARREHSEKKNFKSPSGVEYTAAQLRAAGEKAKKDARKSRFAKYALVALGALVGAYLVPALVTSIFTGVMATATLSTLTAISGVAGLVGGGLLGRTVYNMGGRKERLENNDALAKFMAENIDALNMAENDLQSQEEALRNIERDFDLTYNEATDTMESATFNSVYDEFASVPLSMDEEETQIQPEETNLEPEVEVVDKNKGERQVNSEENNELSEVEVSSEPVEIEEENVYDVEPQIAEPEILSLPGEVAEPAKSEENIIVAEFEDISDTVENEVEPEVEAEPEIEEAVAVDFEESPVVVVEETTEEVVEPEETTEIAEVEQETETEQETSTLSEEQIKKQISAVKARYSRAINSGVCSPVGQYMLVALRDQAEENVRACSTVEEMKEVLEIASEETKQIVEDYKKYTSQEGGHKSICLKELPESEQGKAANETELPAEFVANVDDKTYINALKRSYVKTNEKLVDGYINSIGADESTSSEIRESAKMDLIKTLAEARDFEGINEVISNTESRMKEVKDIIARRVNNAQKEQSEREDEEEMSL